MNKEQISLLAIRDFLAYEDNFAKIKSKKSILRVGDYWEITPEITVVIPVYKRPELAEIAIKSILAQTYQEFQLIIVDDEATGDVINPIEDIIASLNDNRILYFKNSINLGLYANWNRCVELCKSKWVCMVHTDTFLKKNHLKTALEVLNSNPSVSFLAMNKEDIELKDVSELPFQQLFESEVGVAQRLAHMTFFDYNYAMRACIQGSIFSRENFMTLGGIKSDGSIVEDFPFMAKYAYNYGIHYDYRKLWVDCLYDNFGGNPLIWQEQLVYIYYVYRFISLKRPFWVRKAYLKKAQKTIYDEALTYLDGTSWIKKKCDIDIQQLLEDCMIKDVLDLNWFEKNLILLNDKLYNYRKKNVRGRKN